LVYINSRDRVQTQVNQKIAMIAWTAAIPSQFASAAVFSMHHEYSLVVKEIKGGAYGCTSYIIAQTLASLLPMVLLSCTALLPTYAIANLHWPQFGEMLLVHACMIFTFECIAQCFATLPSVITGMLSFIALWFGFYLFSGTVIDIADVLMPLRLCCYASPLRYALRSLVHIEFVSIPFSGAAKCVAPALRPLCAVTPLCPMYCIRGFTCPADPYGLRCYGRDGEEVLESLALYYPDFLSASSTTLVDVQVLLGMALLLKLLLASRLMSICRR